MHLFICYHWLTRPQTVFIFVLHLSAWTFLGLVGEAASLPICFTPALWLILYLPIWLIIFYKMYSKQLGLSVKTWLLHTSIEGSPFRSYLSNIFLEETLKGVGKCLSLEISARAAGVFLITNLLSGLCSCHFFSNIHLLFWRCFLRDIRPLFSLIYCEESTIIGRIASLSWAVSWEVCYLSPVYIFLWWRIFLRAASLLSDGFFKPSFLVFCKKQRIN